MPGMLRTLADGIEKTGAQVAVCTVLDEQEDGNVRKIDTGEERVMTGQDALHSLFSNMGDAMEHQETVWFSVWNKLYRADLFTGIRFDPETDSAEDVPVNVAIFRKAYRVYYLERPYYFWRWRGQSQSNFHAPKALRNAVHTSRLLFETAGQLAPDQRKIAAAAAFRHFYWYYSACVFELSLSRRRASPYSREEYVDVREHMRDILRLMKQDSNYGLLPMRFRLTGVLMLHMPGLFGLLWTGYRRIKRGKK